MKAKRLLAGIFLGLGLVAALQLLILGPVAIVRAANFTVSKFTDTNDGVCDADCSLREAINAANAAPGSDTITLSSGTYNLTLGDLTITSTMTITGNGLANTTISSNGTDRVFDITSTGVATITGVTITNGGNVSIGAGIQNNGVLTLNNSTVANNTATLEGGGIYNNGTLTLNNTIVSNNSAGPGVGVGGGISNAASTGNAIATLNQSQVTTNTINGVGGGGISNSANSNRTATLVLSQTLVSGNVATATTVISTAGFGGGIRNGFFAAANNTGTANMTIENSTISNNQAINGGGIGSGTAQKSGSITVLLNKSTANNNIAAGNGDTVGNGGGVVNLNGLMTLVNSTVSGNAANGTGSASSGVGGGIGNSGLDVATTLWLTNTTVASNSAVSNNGVSLANLNLGAATTANFKNSIFLGNCLNGLGTLTSRGHNLENGNTCNLNATGDIQNSNPLLGPLQNNGGDTQTHALLVGSPADDTAHSATCAASPVNGVDQRDAIRGATACDIGAYEADISKAYLPLVLKSSS
jgi:CSLREA domain-containing protein